MNLKIIQVFAAVAVIAGISEPAYADNVLTGIPSDWRLQNYIGEQGLVVWFSGSTCTSGALTFSSSATADDRNKFFALVLAAKTASKSIGVFYETNTGACQITSFYMQQ